MGLRVSDKWVRDIVYEMDLCDGWDSDRKWGISQPVKVDWFQTQIPLSLRNLREGHYLSFSELVRLRHDVIFDTGRENDDSLGTAHQLWQGVIFSELTPRSYTFFLNYILKHMQHSTRNGLFALQESMTIKLATLSLMDNYQQSQKRGSID